MGLYGSGGGNDSLAHRAAAGGGGGQVNTVTNIDGTIVVTGSATDRVVSAGTITPGLNGTLALSSTTPSTVSLSAPGIGAAATAAKADHSHDLSLSIAPAWTGVHTWTNAAVPVTSTITDASAATQLEAARFRHLSSVTATGGNAVYVSLWATNATPAAAEISRLTAIASVITAGSERGVFVISNAVAGVMTPHQFSTLGDFYATASLALGSITLSTGVVTSIAKLSIVSTMVNLNSNQAANGGFTFTGTVNVSGARQYFVITPSSNTTTTGGTEVQFFEYQAHTNQFASNTAVASQREFCIKAPTYAFATAGGVISDAATLYVSAAPIVGTNAAITRAYSLWTDDGDVRHDNIGVALGGGATPTLGTIGGSGPATAAQNKWARLNIDGTNYFIPVWV